MNESQETVSSKEGRNQSRKLFFFFLQLEEPRGGRAGGHAEPSGELLVLKDSPHQTKKILKKSFRFRYDFTL